MPDPGYIFFPFLKISLFWETCWETKRLEGRERGIRLVAYSLGCCDSQAWAMPNEEFLHGGPGRRLLPSQARTPPGLAPMWDARVVSGSLTLCHNGPSLRVVGRIISFICWVILGLSAVQEVLFLQSPSMLFERECFLLAFCPSTAHTKHTPSAFVVVIILAGHICFKDPYPPWIH